MSSQPLDYHSHYCDSKFSLWNRPADLNNLFMYFGKTPILSPCILSPCISLMLILLCEGILAEYEFQNDFCRMLGFPPRWPVSYRAPPTHPYLLFITSNWTVALETVVMSQVTSLWLNEGKKIEQKHIPVSTCNLGAKTVSHTFSVFQSTFW